MVSGLSVAVHDCVVFKDARFRKSSFRDCPLLRFNEMPEVEVYMRHRACFPHAPKRDVFQSIHRGWRSSQ